MKELRQRALQYTQTKQCSFQVESFHNAQYQEYIDTYSKCILDSIKGENVTLCNSLYNHYTIHTYTLFVLETITYRGNECVAEYVQLTLAHIPFRTNLAVVPRSPTKVSAGLSTNVPKATRLSFDAALMAPTTRNKHLCKFKSWSNATGSTYSVRQYNVNVSFLFIPFRLLHCSTFRFLFHLVLFHFRQENCCST